MLTRCPSGRYLILIPLYEVNFKESFSEPGLFPNIAQDITVVSILLLCLPHKLLYFVIVTVFKMIRIVEDILILFDVCLHVFFLVEVFFGCLGRLLDVVHQTPVILLEEIIYLASAHRDAVNPLFSQVHLRSLLSLFAGDVLLLPLWHQCWEVFTARYVLQSLFILQRINEVCVANNDHDQDYVNDDCNDDIQYENNYGDN